jgi:hypothetical protein
MREALWESGAVGAALDSLLLANRFGLPEVRSYGALLSAVQPSRTWCECPFIKSVRPPHPLATR